MHSTGQPETHHVQELHNTLSLPSLANDDVDAEFVKACDAITHARVQECLELVLNDPRHKDETLLLVMHGASSKAAVKYLSGGSVVTTTVCSYAAFDQVETGGGGSAGGGAEGSDSNDGAWNLLTGGVGMRDDYLQAHGSSVGIEGAGDAG